jgi:hypothetical protein
LSSWKDGFTKAERRQREFARQLREAQKVILSASEEKADDA